MESRFLNVEVMMNKKIVKGIQQLGLDTKLRLSAMHQETKSKLNHIYMQLQADATKKFKLQMKQLDEQMKQLGELKSNVTEDVMQSISSHTS